MACVTRFQTLRGTTAQRLSMIPLLGELVFDTDLNIMFVGDGATYGGIPFSGDGEIYTVVIYTTNTVLTVESYAIADSGSAIQFTLPDANSYQKPIKIKNINTGVLTVVGTGGQNIFVRNLETDIQLRKGEAVELIAKSGVWYLW